MTPLLILVHPGSLCGSYHTSEAFEPARIRALLEEVESFEGTVVSIDGAFMDEVRASKWQFQPEIARAYARCDRHYRGNDTEKGLSRAAARIAADFGVAKGACVLVTGAWADPKDGCVTAVAEALRQIPHAVVEVSQHAVSEEEVACSLPLPQAAAALNDAGLGSHAGRTHR